MDEADKMRIKGGQNSRKYMSKEKATELARKANAARHKKNKK